MAWSDLSFVSHLFLWHKINTDKDIAKIPWQMTYHTHLLTHQPTGNTAEQFLSVLSAKKSKKVNNFSILIFYQKDNLFMNA